MFHSSGCKNRNLTGKKSTKVGERLLVHSTLECIEWEPGKQFSAHPYTDSVKLYNTFTPNLSVCFMETFITLICLRSKLGEERGWRMGGVISFTEAHFSKLKLPSDQLSITQKIRPPEDRNH